MCLGIPGQIVGIEDAASDLATVDVCGIRRSVNISCILAADRAHEQCVGEWVLVHVGFAMSRIDPIEAEATLRILEEIGEIQAEMEAMAASSAIAAE